jgi:GrpB-like predicted nucleotidyltransferase (UPF0157 family)
MDEMRIVPYDPRWPAMYLAEADLLGSILPSELVVSMEHIGSTAVPGLSAKPVIDILIAVPYLKHAREIAVPALEKHGYAFWSENPRSDRLFFVKGLPPKTPHRTHHLHMAEQGSDIKTLLLFRDYLRTHSQEVWRYAALKSDLMAQHQSDREAYTAAKSSYIDQVVARALRESSKAARMP